MINRPDVYEELRRLLCEMQLMIRAKVCAAQTIDDPDDLRAVAKQTAADTIYGIDVVGEEAVQEWFRDQWPAWLPVEVIMEGIEDGKSLCFPEGIPRSATEWKCIIDPIDGTRNLMYDKRSAWVLGGIAPQAGAANTLRDIQVAAMTELPTSKQWRSDQLSAIRGRGTQAEMHDVRCGGGKVRFSVCPSAAIDCRQGFAAISRFFPEGLEVLAKIEEKLWSNLYSSRAGSSLGIFTDQYLTTGGQLYELTVGHDRFLADLRPIVYEHLRMKYALCCHPYDMAALLVAEEAGVIVEDPLTQAAICVPLNTTAPVSWAGYANVCLADHIRPELKRAIQDTLLDAPVSYSHRSVGAKVS